MSVQEKYLHSDAYFQHLRMMLFMLMIAKGGFCMMALFMVRFQVFIAAVSQASLNEVFGILIPILNFCCMVIAFIGLNIVVKQASSKTRLLDKLEIFEDALVLYWAILGIANGMNIIAYMLTGNKVMLLYFVGMSLFYLITNPTPRIVSNILQLSTANRRLLLTNGNLRSIQ